MYNDNFHTDSLFSDTWRATLMTVYAEGRGESHREWYFVRGTKCYCRLRGSGIPPLAEWYFVRGMKWYCRLRRGLFVRCRPPGCGRSPVAPAGEREKYAKKDEKTVLVYFTKGKGCGKIITVRRRVFLPRRCVNLGRYKFHINGGIFHGRKKKAFYGR